VRLEPQTSTLAPVPDVVIDHEIDPIAEEWDALADRVAASPFSRPGWMTAWWRCFGRGELSVLSARRDGRISAVLPVERRRGVVAALANSETPLVEPLHEDGDAWASLVSALLEGRAAGRVVQLSRVEATAPALAELRRQAPAAGYRMTETPLKCSLYVRVDGDWPAYEAARDQKVRSEVRRRRRLLEREGRLWVEVSDGAERLDALLEEGLAVEAAAWKGSAGTAIASLPQMRSFYTEVAEWAAKRGILRLAFLRLDERALAFDFALEEHDVHYLLKTGYDPEHRRFAPGIILRREMISRAFTEGLQRYEFLGSAYEWKRRWADDAHELVSLEAFAPSPAGYLEWAARARIRPLARRLLRRE
jgi:CelD/BcsL family acetyltransferase involved in cellulose biosynthesis